MRCAHLLLLAPGLITATLSGQQAPTITEQVSGTTAGLIAVSAVNEQVVWVSGTRGTVLRTLDGGDTWSIRPVPGGEQLQFRDIHAVSADTAWVLSIGNGADSRIYRTTNGGSSWDLQFSNPDTLAFYDCMAFFDRRQGFAISDAPDALLRILRTDNGGASWALIPREGQPAALKDEGAFAASGGCAVSWGERHGWIAAGTPGSRVFRTTDAGRTWTVHNTPLYQGPGGGMAAVAFRDSLHGIAVASRNGVALDTTSAAVALTRDGGVTWQLLPNRPPAGSLYGVTWFPGIAPTAAIASSLGGLMLTRDEGTTWTLVSPVYRYWAVGTAGRYAWGVGVNGKITRLGGGS